MLLDSHNTGISSGKIAANFIINDLLGLLKKNKLTIEQCPLSPEMVGGLARLVRSGGLEKKSMRKLLIKWFNEALDSTN